MLNWIIWNRTVFILNSVLMLNWIVWNRTVFILNSVLMLNWIVWNGTVFILNSVLMLNWIVWNRIVFILNSVLMLNWIVWNRTVFILNSVLMLNWIVWNRTVYIYKNGFGINLKWLICHRTKPKQSNPEGDQQEIHNRNDIFDVSFSESFAKYQEIDKICIKINMNIQANNSGNDKTTNSVLFSSKWAEPCRNYFIYVDLILNNITEFVI